jgi:hypothetical protein
MSPLARLASRASAQPSFLGFVLAAYQRRNGFTDAILADLLGCTVETLANVRLCWLPRVDHFAADCRSVAEKFGVKVDVLEEICWPW